MITGANDFRILSDTQEDTILHNRTVIASEVTVVSLLAPGLPPQIFAWIVSSELFNF